MSEAKRNFKMPHTFVILFAIIVLATLASYVVPAGTFDRARARVIHGCKSLFRGPSMQ